MAGTLPPDVRLEPPPTAMTDSQLEYAFNVLAERSIGDPDHRAILTPIMDAVLDEHLARRV